MKKKPLVLGLREQIVEQLRSDILTGRFQSGERISETSLVERFQVSRTPIREALQQMVHEGLLESKPNCGVRVVQPVPGEVHDLIIPIRRTIETYALRRIFDTLSFEDFRLWDEILTRMADACRRKDYPAIAEEDIAFHRSLIRRANLPDLEAVWTAIVNRIRIHFRQTQKQYADPTQIHAEHVAIVDAFRSDKLDEAIRKLEQNIE